MDQSPDRETVPVAPFPEPSRAGALSGDEELGPGMRVRDFWAWGFSDLRLNTTRGLLAQFLVARALGDERATDEGWGNFDVLTPEGIRVEVKSSAYVQSWRQDRPSRIVFGGLTGYAWSDDAGWGPEREVRADVFVFAIHTCQDAARYDMLDLSAWEFRALPASTIERLGIRSMSAGTLFAHAPGAVPWSGLQAIVLSAARLQRGERE